jgi:hypothetical protein
LAEGRDGLFDRGFAGVGIGGVRLNRDRLSAVAFFLHGIFPLWLIVILE